MSKLTTYIAGYFLSIILTIAAFGAVELQLLPTTGAIVVLLILLALVQLLVQLFFFLHIGKGQNRHWNAVALLFTVFIVCVVVGGTLWIMSDLHASMSGNPFENNHITPQTEG